MLEIYNIHWIETLFPKKRVEVLRILTISILLILQAYREQIV